MTTSNEHNNAPAVPQGVPAQEVIDAIEAWKSAWLKVPPFADRVNKATREAITISHNSLFLLLQSAQQAQRMPAACPTPTGCGPHGCHGACIATPAPAPAQDEPFGHFRAEPFGWTDCAKDDEGAIALYERPQEVGLTNRQFDLICQAIDKADTATMEGDYMLDSDDCINVVRVMQALFDVTKPAQEVVIPQGYEIHELPPDYSGPVWIESQVRQLARQTACASQPTTDTEVGAQEVGLTDEEIEAIAQKHMSTVGDHWCNEDAIRERHAEDFARAIIAALRAKGQS